MGALSIIAMAACAATGVLAPDGDAGDRIAAALSGFSNSTIWLIVSAFFAARAVIASGLGERLAYLFVRVFGRSTIGLAPGRRPASPQQPRRQAPGHQPAEI